MLIPYMQQGMHHAAVIICEVINMTPTLEYVYLMSAHSSP